MKNPIKYYHIYKEPDFLIKGFRNDFEFVVWLRINNLKYLKYILKCFENEELYEYCSIIQNVISEKIKEKKILK